MGASSPWLVRDQRAGPGRLRLICLPYAGASARVFQPWPGSLHPDVEVVAVQYPGRGPRFGETAMRSHGQLVSAMREALRPLLDRPFVLLGHSLGALLAFELAHELRASDGLLPSGLIVSARQPPHLPPRRPPAFHLPHAQFVHALRTYDGTPEEVLADAELMALLLPALRADFAIADLYQAPAREPLPCPACVLGGSHDPHVPVEDLVGWQRHFGGTVSIRVFSGGHFFLHADPSGFSAHVNACLVPWLAAT